MILMSTIRPIRHLLAVLLGLAVLATASACSSPNGPASNGKPSIVVGAYPFQFVAERVAGNLATVTNLLAPGADGHDLELSPKQVAAVGKADLVVYLSGYQSPLDAAVNQQRPGHVLDVGDFLQLLPAPGTDHGHEHSTTSSDGHDYGSYDPHVWLNPLNLALIGAHVAEALSRMDPANTATFEANAQQLTKDMNELDASFNAGLAHCRTDVFVANHAAFGYLAERYGLHQVGISGLSTEAEPSPAHIAEVQQIAREHQLTTIFYETAVSPKVAQAIAADLGLMTDVLDPLETLSPESRGGDYIEVMTANLTSLRKANGCQ